MGKPGESVNNNNKYSECSEVFFKRSGTTNKGTAYEIWNIKNIVLNLLTNEDIQNFYISSNDKDYGDFDDIVVELDFSDRRETFAFQLKHCNNNANLCVENLKQNGGDFSLKKYFTSFQKYNRNVEHFILFTNRNVLVSEDTQFQLDGENFSIKLVELETSHVFNTSSKSKSCYRFEIVEGSYKNDSEIEQYEEFFSKFLLYASQQNLERLKNDTIQKFKKKFATTSNEFNNFQNMISEWNMAEGKKEKLNKEWMQRAIAIHVLSPYVKAISFGEVNENMKIFREGMSNFEVTVFEEKESYKKVKEFWGDVQDALKDLGKLNTIRKKYYLSHVSFKSFAEVDEKVLSEVAWLMNKCPLLIEENRRFKKISRMCKFGNFVVFGRQLKQNWLKESQTFQTLSALKGTRDYVNLIETFTFSIQGKPDLKLKQLVKDNDDFTDFLRTDDLLEMLNNPWTIGEGKEVLTQPYVERSLSKNIVNIKYLQSVKNDTFIIIDSVNELDYLRKQFHGYNFVDIYNEEEEIDPERHKIITTIGVCKVTCGKKKFEDVCARNGKFKNIHHFRLQRDGNLLWIRSLGNIHDIEHYKISDNSFIMEKDLSLQAENNINIIVGDPGMGKSKLLRSLKNNSSKDLWVVLLNPNDLNFTEDLSEKNIETFILNKCEDKRQKEIMKYFLRKNKVVLLWDAIDEILKSRLEEVTDVILRLSQKNVIQWITSRSHLKNFLENKLSVFSVQINQFNEKEQEVYMEERFVNLKSSLVLIEKIKSTFMLIEHTNVLGIPLQLFLLTELFCQDPQKYFNLLNQTFIITDLYYYFVEEKFKIYYQEKKNIDPQNLLLQDLKDDLKEELHQKFLKLALQTLLPADVLKRLDTNFEKDLQNFENIISLGLVTEIENQIPRFLHISFAEYFVALYFSENQKYMEIISEFLFEAKYNNVRFFFDLLLANKSLPHIAVLYKNLNLLESCENISTSKDTGGRSPLHLACSWGQRYPNLNIQKYGTVFVIDDSNLRNVAAESIENLRLLDKLIKICEVSDVDKLFHLPPLWYAKKSNCVSGQIKIFEKQNIQLSFSEDDLNLLYYSARLGITNTIDLFRSKLPFVKTMKEGNSLMHLSVEFESFISKILQNEVYKNAIDDKNVDGETPLHRSCAQGCFDSSRILIEHGADLNSKNKAEETPLYLASLHGREEIVELLVQKGADVNASDAFGFRPLLRASEKGYDKIVVCLVKNGAKINATNNLGVTALHRAAENGNEKIVKILVDNGAQVGTADSDGHTALHRACERGHTEIVKFLVEQGAEINSADIYGSIPLHSAAEKGHLEIVEFLVSKGAGVNTPGIKEYTPLHRASERGHKLVVEYLTSNGAKIDAVDRYGSSPLHRACIFGHNLVVEYLVSIGAPINTPDKAGRMPIHIASEKGHDKIVEFLALKGADVRALDNRGYSPLDRASEMGHLKIVKFLVTEGSEIEKFNFSALHRAAGNGHEEIVEFLVGKGAKINIAAVDKNGYTPLHLASIRGHINIVEFLVKNGAKIDAVDNYQCTPLHRASEKGHYQCVEFLVSKGAKIDFVEKFGYTPLHRASDKGHLKIVKFLVARGAEINVLDAFQFTPLHRAAEKDHFPVVEFLVGKGAQINHADKDGYTPLHRAASAGHFEIVKYLVKNGAKVNISDRFIYSPLSRAAERGHIQIVKFLILKGAYIGAIDKDGYTPLHRASEKGFLKVVEYLVEKGADVNSSDNHRYTPLHRACEKGHEDVVKFLLGKGSNINDLDKYSCTPLNRAADKGFVEIVSILLDRGAKVDVPDKDGFTPLLRASKKGFEKIVELLFKNGAQIDIVDRFSYTPLHRACENCHEDVVKFLLDKGAKVDVPDKDGFTPLLRASQKGFEKIVELLFKNGAQIDIVDRFSYTPLHRACENGHYNVVKSLIEMEVDIDRVNRLGNTPLHRACFYGHYAIVEFLVNNGANINAVNKDGMTPTYLSFTRGHYEIHKLLVAKQKNNYSVA